MLSWNSTLRPISGGFSPFVRSNSGGQSLSGFEQIQSQLHDRWAATYTFSLGRDDRILAMRALLSSLRGRTNTIALPVFDRVRRPVSASTAGSPIGTSVVNPTFAQFGLVIGTPIGNSYANPTFQRLTYHYGAPVGNSAANPVFANRWPHLEGTPYEFSTDATITGTALIEGTVRVRFTPSGAQPAIGQYVTLESIRRRILDIDTDGSDKLLTVYPAFDAAPGDQFATLAAITGTAEIESANEVRFTPTGTAPTAGQYVTLLSVRRLIQSVEVDGADRILTVNPAFEVTHSNQYTTIAGITGTAVIQGATRVKFTPTGTEPAVGQYVTLLSVRRRIEGITVSGSDRYLAIHPPFTVAASTPGTVAAVVNANALINAVSIDIHFTTGGPPLAGHRFSLASRLYEIDTVTSLGSGVYRLGIWPWLRAAAASSDVANFSAPVCEMRLASDQDGTDAMRSLDLMRFGDVTLGFDEVAVIT